MVYRVWAGECKGQHFAYNVWPVDVGDTDQLPWQIMVGYFDGAMGSFLFFVLDWFGRLGFWISYGCRCYVLKG